MHGASLQARKWPSQGLKEILTRPILDRPLRPERLLLEAKGEALREGGRPCEAMPLKMACRIANTLALEFSSRTFTCDSDSIVQSGAPNSHSHTF